MCLPTFTGPQMLATADVLEGVASLAQGYTRGAMNRADAAYERAAADAKADRVRTAGAREKGAARVQAVGAGVSLASPSVLEAERSIDRLSEQDALSAIVSGDNRADSLERGARYYERAGLVEGLTGIAGGADRWRRVKRQSFGSVLDPFFGGTGRSGD